MRVLVRQKHPRGATSQGLNSHLVDPSWVALRKWAGNRVPVPSLLSPIWFLMLAWCLMKTLLIPVLRCRIHGGGWAGPCRGDNILLSWLGLDEKGAWAPLSFPPSGGSRWKGLWTCGHPPEPEPAKRFPWSSSQVPWQSTGKPSTTPKQTIIQSKQNRSKASLTMKLLQIVTWPLFEYTLLIHPYT